MGGDAEIGLYPLQHSNHRLRIEPIEGESPPRVQPRLVGALVNHAHDIWRFAHHGDVRLFIDILKEPADVFYGVNMFDNALSARGEGFFESLRGTHMASPGGRGEKKDARFAAHRRFRLLELAANRRAFFFPEDSARKGH